MTPFRRLLLPAMLALALGAHAQQPAEPATSAPPEPSALDDAMFYQLLLGEISLREGDAGSAFGLIFAAAEKLHDERLFRRAAEIAQHARAGDAVLRAARAWSAALPLSTDASRLLLFTLINLNRPAETAQPLANLLARLDGPTRADALAQLPRLYARTTDKVAAARAVERALQPDLAAPSGLVWGVLGRMRLQAGQTALAQEAAAQVLKSGAFSETSTLFGLELMERNLPQGEELVEPGLQGAGRDDLRLAYARLLIRQERYRAARTVLQDAVRHNPELDTAWLILGSLQMQERLFDAAQVSLARYVEQAARRLGPDSDAPRPLAQAYFYLADLAALRKDHIAALDWLGKVTTEKDLPQAHLRRARLLAQLGRLDEARQAYDALAALNVGDREDVDITYEQAMVAEKLGDLVQMEKLLRHVIAVKPDHPAAYNALGYSLAERNLRLAEAKSLIEKAVALVPSDPFIADSLGWVEFRLGNKADAVRILETAFKARPDAEIAAHLGEVLWSLGERDRALAYLKQGHDLNPDNETLANTLKRLKVKW